jgi:hypothetical protein
VDRAVPDVAADANGFAETVEVDQPAPWLAACLGAELLAARFASPHRGRAITSRDGR